jgi:NTP pyrophosphatase (non-canonical NTP hydrolase)
VGEMARIIARKYGEQSYKTTDANLNLADEMADVLFVLICLANQTQINLEEAFKQNIEKKPSAMHYDTNKILNFNIKFNWPC